LWALSRITTVRNPQESNMMLNKTKGKRKLVWRYARHLFTSWAMSRIIRSMTSIGIYAAVFICVVDYFGIGYFMMMEKTALLFIY